MSQGYNRFRLLTNKSYESEAGSLFSILQRMWNIHITGHLLGYMSVKNYQNWATLIKLFEKWLGTVFPPHGTAAAVLSMHYRARTEGLSQVMSIC